MNRKILILMMVVGAYLFFGALRVMCIVEKSNIEGLEYRQAHAFLLPTMYWGLLLVCTGFIREP